METWLRDGAVCISTVASGIVHFSMRVPHEGKQDCVHGMAFTAPVFGHRTLLFLDHFSRESIQLVSPVRPEMQAVIIHLG